MFHNKQLMQYKYNIIYTYNRIYNINITDNKSNNRNNKSKYKKHIHRYTLLKYTKIKNSRFLYCISIYISCQNTFTIVVIDNAQTNNNSKTKRHKTKSKNNI